MRVKHVRLPLAVFTEQLLHTLRADKAVVVQAPEDLMCHSAVKQQRTDVKL